MNGKLPIYVRFGTVKPEKVTQPFLANWQAQPVEMEEAQDFANRLQKNMTALKNGQPKKISIAYVYTMQTSLTLTLL